MIAKKRTSTSVGLLVFLCVGFLWANSTEITGSAIEQPRYGGTFIHGIVSDIPQLQYHTYTHVQAMIPTGKIYNTLVKFGVDSKLYPELAESWTVSPDGLTYTFKLVKNATWHDGKPFTSADVKFTFEEISGRWHPRGSTIMKCLDMVETPDQYTVVFKLKYAYAPFMQGLIPTNGGCILPKHLWEPYKDEPLKCPQNQAPVGTGPFKFKEYVRGSHITLVRNENYWRKGKPYVDKLVLKIMPDHSVRMLSFEKKEVDYIGYAQVDESFVAKLSKIPGMKMTTAGDFIGGIIVGFINLRHPILSNVKVRQAISHAINRQAMVDLATFGFGDSRVGPIGSTVEWAFNPKIPDMMKYDVNLANKLLDEAGYPRGKDGIRFSIKCQVRKGVTRVEKGSEIMRDNLKEVGIDLVLELMETATQDDRTWLKWDFEISVFAMMTGPDPAIGAERQYTSENIKKASAVNCMGYNNSRVDWLFEQARRETDEKKRVQYYYEVQEEIVRDMPAVFMFSYCHVKMWWDDWEGVYAPHTWGGGSSGDTCEDVWWRKGSAVGQEAAAAAIKKAESEVASLQGQQYDVSGALKKLEQAKKALSEGKYSEAVSLAEAAVKEAQPPYALYGGVAIAIIAVVVVAVYWAKKRKPKA